MFNTNDINFDVTDSVFNVLTRKVVPKQFAEQFPDVQKIGGEKYQKLAMGRIEDVSSI